MNGRDPMLFNCQSVRLALSILLAVTLVRGGEQVTQLDVSKLLSQTNCFNVALRLGDPTFLSSAFPSRSLATNNFAIHLQEGFYERREVIITVDGRVVYKDIPTTGGFGFAGKVSVTTWSTRPVVSFIMPDKGIIWVEQIDLNKGAALGIYVTENGRVRVQQAASFAYE